MPVYVHSVTGFFLPLGSDGVSFEISGPCLSIGGTDARAATNFDNGDLARIYQSICGRARTHID